MRNATLFGKDRILESWSNICFNRKQTPIDIMDAIEDARTAQELVDNLSKLNLPYPFVLDRETEEYVRVVWTDNLGNKKYIKAYK